MYPFASQFYETFPLIFSIIIGIEDIGVIDMNKYLRSATNALGFFLWRIKLR